ncbi:hypothetical protein AB0M46_20550 [Dactylosporangium sp. NPDC051485]|uniref:hypothetical protein n=1 Tax=Dactylosporangium sp. NPDC051485 TaxID=3154846 RepID=UPI00343592FD
MKGVGVVVAGGALAVLAGCGGTAGAAPAASGPVIAGECPAVWDGAAVSATRTGDLVPAGARSALLCSYADPDYRLRARRSTADGVAELTGYLNGLPGSRRADSLCDLSAGTEHVIVFEYAGRAPAVVTGRNCAWDQEGAVRYQADIRKITAYWSVTFRD